MKIGGTTGDAPTPPLRHKVGEGDAIMRRLLVVKLSDIGDVLTATPALRALRETFRDARIDVLVPPRSAAALRNCALVDELLVFDKFGYDRVRDALRPLALRDVVAFARGLRARRYDALVLPHHLTTRWGALKWAALALAAGAPMRAGLDNGRGWFLTQRVRDDGFGARHEVEYCMAVVNAIGARTADWRLEIGVADADRMYAEQLLQSQDADAVSRGTNGRRSPIVLHPGSGGHSPARRWPLERWCELGRALGRRPDAQVVIVGTASDGGHELARQLPAALDLTDRTTLGQLAALLQRARLFVGADSGVMHIAAASDVPLVALFGTTNAKAWGPWRPGGERCTVVQSETPGCPCSYVGFRIRSDACEARGCMQGISVERVLDAARRLLDG